MLDKNAQGIIAEGDPHELKEHSRDPRVIAFFNRQPPKTRKEEIQHG
jgi:phospholipid/cholesterol/gamma-HCH transport system ATP-binding protein